MNGSCAPRMHHNQNEDRSEESEKMEEKRELSTVLGVKLRQRRSGAMDDSLVVARRCARRMASRTNGGCFVEMLL